MGDKMKTTIMALAAMASIMAMLIGLHNIDNSWNMVRMESLTGRNLMDCTMERCMNINEAYETGIMLTMGGTAMLALITSFMIGDTRWTTKQEKC